MKIRDLKDRLKELNTPHSLAEWIKVRNKNLKNDIWACACGSRKFHLLQSNENIKTICIKCGEMEIIAWNGNTKEHGKIRRLDTGRWTD